jgi:hypothetical protein
MKIDWHKVQEIAGQEVHYSVLDRLMSELQCEAGELAPLTAESAKYVAHKYAVCFISVGSIDSQIFRLKRFEKELFDALFV